MKLIIATVVALPLLLSGCGSIPLLPPADVPVAVQTAPARADSDWRPYSSGPMQNSSSRRNRDDWSGSTVTREVPVTRNDLPPVVYEPPTESLDTSAVSPRSPERQPSPQPQVPAAAAPADGWGSYKGGRNPSPSPAAASVFGSGVNSAWAAGYVPEPYRIEFGIFAQKAAKDGEARMTMPTGEVYSASVTRRNGACSTIEVSVLADGDLPVISRGLVQVCK